MPDVNYEVILVDRVVDVKLRLIERALFKEKSSNSHLIRARSTRNFDELILKLADFVVKRLGGPVVNFGELRKRWARRRSQLQVGLKTPVLSYLLFRCWTFASPSPTF